MMKASARDAPNWKCVSLVVEKPRCTSPILEIFGRNLRGEMDVIVIGAGTNEPHYLNSHFLQYTQVSWPDSRRKPTELSSR